ncbi:protein FAR1-RELATED SEQUENCE 5-like [Camellia sinensis]|uniref:protein FAR1-RELATED SEQUENCE 5-like n=1 Tax=Camellia sinensis TaxID=4442 RepID=UPI0010368A6E|nr:protein FAR1-RELATED SEQUENCE 5-like [Camellia sinensis]
MKDSSFHFTVQLDVGEQITNIFWADPKMIIDYSLFGDFVSFDTTYRTHKDYRPLAVFVGFNNYRKTVIFGAALLYDETIASFEWLFKSFLDAMSGKQPKTIFTDQDPAMTKAISLVMPNTFHRICTWHMRRNAIKHLGSKYRGDDGGIGAELAKFIYNYEDEESFSSAWEDMLDKFDVRDNNLGILYFFKHFERVIDDITHIEFDCEYASRQKLPKIGLPIPLLINVGDFYTNPIFEIFKEKILKSLSAFAWKQDESNLSHDCMVKVLDKPKVREVKVNLQGPTVSCTCKLFESCGILCAHALKGLDMMNIKDIPKQYLLKRWAKKAKNGIVQDINRCINTHTAVDLDVNFRYRMLCPNLIKLGCHAAESLETTDMLAKFTVEMAKKIDDILSRQPSVGQQASETHAPFSSKSCEEVLDKNQPHNLHTLGAKGLKKKEGLGKSRPRKRPKSWVELQAKSKKSRQMLEPQSTPHSSSTFADTTYPPLSDCSLQGVGMSSSMACMIPETPQAWNDSSFTQLEFRCPVLCFVLHFKILKDLEVLCVETK